MSLFTLSPARTTRTATTDELFELVWWPVVTTLLGGMLGLATAQALGGDLFPLLGLSLSLVTLPVGQWLMEVLEVVEEAPIPVPKDGWAQAMMDQFAEELPDSAILPLPSPAPLPRLPRTSREVLTGLLREAAFQASESLLGLLEDAEDLDMHAEACKDFIWV